MAIPPGNKLIGQLGATIGYVGGLPDLTSSSVRTISALALAVVKNPVSLPNPLPPKFANIGAVAVTMSYSQAETLTLKTLMSLAVVQYQPPTDVITRNQFALAVVKPSDLADNIEPVKAAQIGALGIDARYNVAVEDCVRVINCIGVAVVKYHEPYKTTSLVNIEYAASAKLNTEDLL